MQDPYQLSSIYLPVVELFIGTFPVTPIVLRQCASIFVFLWLTIIGLCGQGLILMYRR